MMKFKVDFQELNNNFNMNIESSKQEFNMAIDTDSRSFDLEFDVYAGDNIYVDKYTGEYDVFPKVIEQKLHTSHKCMTDDVTVHNIELQKVSNVEGGYTAIIGGI